MSRRQRIALISMLVTFDVLFIAIVLFAWSWVSRSSLASLKLGAPMTTMPDPAMRILPLEVIALVEVALIAGFAFGRHWRAIAPILLSGPALATVIVAALMVGRALPGHLGHFGPFVVFSREFDRVDGLWTAIIAWGPSLLAAALVVGIALARGCGVRIPRESPPVQQAHRADAVS